jgi:hypothetical protein
MAKFKTAKQYGSQVLDAGYSNTGSTAQVGGLVSIAGNQIAPEVKVGSNASSAGSIIRQKGMHKFLVTDGTHTGVCTLVDTNTLTDNTMYILCTKADTTTFYAKKITNKFVWDFSDNKYRVGATANAGTVPATVAVALA